MPPRTILLVGTDDLGWAELRALLTELPDLEVIEAVTTRQAVAATATSHPVAIFIAPQFEAVSALPLIRELSSISPASRFVVFGASDPDDDTLLALRDVSASYLVWSELSPAGLQSCVSAVIEAPVRIGNERLVQLFFAAIERQARADIGQVVLTDRQRAVLRHLSAGRTRPQIAAAEHLSRSTVDRTMAELFDSFGVSSATEFIAEASRRGMLL